MAITLQNIVDKAIILGSLDSLDVTLMERLAVTVEMVIAKTDAYIGYDCTTIDALCSILAEISVTQVTQYTTLESGSATSTKRITRGDYTVEYDNSSTKDVFNSYEWLLRKYKKLVTI